MEQTEQTEFKNYLESRILAFTFTKKDGTERAMVATKCFEYIAHEHRPKPPVTEGEEKKPRKPLPENMVRVFDLEKEGWRTVDLNKVTEWKVSTSHMMTANIYGA